MQNKPEPLVQGRVLNRGQLSAVMFHGSTTVVAPLNWLGRVAHLTEVNIREDQDPRFSWKVLETKIHGKQVMLSLKHPPLFSPVNHHEEVRTLLDALTLIYGD